MDDKTIAGLGRFELIEKFRVTLKERDAYLENLTSVQARCTELLEETRSLKRTREQLLEFNTELDRLERDLAVVRFVGEQPTRATNGSVGWDLVAADDVTIRDGETVMIATRTRIALPPGFEGQVRGRSGLAKSGVTVATGTVDSDYRGTIHVIVTYHRRPDAAWVINAGDRIAQLVIQRVPEVRWERVEQLDDIERGDRGFGSSGS